MPLCPACSQPTAHDSRFCPACGAPVSGAASDLAQTTPVGSTTTTPADHARFIPGAIVADRYRIAGLLGKGGMGEVYRADDLTLGQPVALKFLPEGLEQDPKRRERFLNEVRTARQVTHPNVCRVYDLGEVEGQHFLSMEYVDGEDLASLLRRVGRLPGERAVTVARQICAGLAAAHDQGILHRDLKPANVMIDGQGRVRLTDFGLASLASGIDGDDVVAGTPAYMAPEQISGRGVSARSDIYSLGLVLYELFTGQPTFQGDSAAELRTQHETSTPTSPSHHVAEGLDPAVERAVLHCLEKDPQDRPASALAVSAALPGGDPLAAALAAGETPSPELVAEAGTREAMNPGAALLLAVVAVVLFVGATRWAATMTILHYLPLEKRPEVLVDRAHEILEQLGFTEPAYTQPADSAWGTLVWWSQVEAVGERDSSATRWERLRQRPDAASLWYRQSPQLILPPPAGVPIFSRGQVQLANPLPTTPGEAMVVLDLAGRLRRLEVLPKRYSTNLDAGEPDWAPLFELAELDRERFQEVPPRYQRFLAPDHRRAWLGTRVDQPELQLRVEAGSFEGRPILFNIATPQSLESLSVEPKPRELDARRVVLESLPSALILLVILFSIRLSRRNLNRGRSDPRGASRFAVTMFVLYVVAEALKSHALFTSNAAAEIWPILVAGTFIGVVMWGMYSAAEPLGRQVWPTMFVSASRLLSRPRVQWRDPLIGRSVLIGLIGGVVLFLFLGPIPKWLDGVVDGAPTRPWGYNVNVLLGQRQALGWLLDRATTVGVAFILVVALVVIRRMVRRKWLALVMALLVWTLIDGVGDWDDFAFGLITAGISMTVLLRWGVVAMMVTQLVSQWAWFARATELGAWYGETAVMTLALVAALAVYGVWAATGGRSAAFAPTR